MIWIVALFLAFLAWLIQINNKMKTKFSRFLTLILAFVVQITFAQQQSVTGTVADEDGLPLPGVNIIIKGTTTGVQSDFDGNYAIQAAQGDVLVFSFIGLKKEEYTVGDSYVINVTLEADAAQLSEVVVTALGIKREKKSLGYATQEVDGAAVSDVPTTNFMNSLSGKVAGVNIKACLLYTSDAADDLLCVDLG